MWEKKEGKEGSKQFHFPDPSSGCWDWGGILSQALALLPRSNSEHSTVLLSTGLRVQGTEFQVRPEHLLVRDPGHETNFSNCPSSLCSVAVIIPASELPLVSKKIKYVHMVDGPELYP